MSRFAHIAMAALAAIAGIAPAPADARRGGRQEAPYAAEVDQDEALARRQREEIKPLSEVLAVGQSVVPGEVVRVRMKHVRGRAAYELKIITPQGQLREIYIDAMTLDTLKVE